MIITSKIISLFLKFTRKDEDKVVVLKFEGLGDFVLFLDCAKGLRELYKDKKLVLVCSHDAYELSQNLDIFDEVIYIKREKFNLFKAYSLIKILKNLSCGMLINTAISRDFPSEMLTCMIKATKKVNVTNSFLAPKYLKKWVTKNYHTEIKVNPQDMSLIVNAQIVRGLGFTDFVAGAPKLPTVKNQHVALPKHYFVVFIGGSRKAKIWNEEKYVEIASLVSQKTKMPFVLCGDKYVLEYENYFFEHCKSEFYSYIAKTDIAEMLEIISKAEFVFGSDTSGIHIASAYKVPSLCVCSAEAGDRFYPYVVENKKEWCYPVAVKKPMQCKNCSFKRETFHECAIKKRSKRLDCIENITVDDVKLALEQNFELGENYVIYKGLKN